MVAIFPIHLLGLWESLFFLLFSSVPTITLFEMLSQPVTRNQLFPIHHLGFLTGVTRSVNAEDDDDNDNMMMMMTI